MKENNIEAKWGMGYPASSQCTINASLNESACMGREEAKSAAMLIYKSVKNVQTTEMRSK
jgi:hypothetical protein